MSTVFRLAPSTSPRPAPGLGFAWGSALLAGLLTLIAFWPAQWAAATFNRFSERIRLLEAQGTLWNGSAWIGLSSGPGGTTTAWGQRLQWRLAPTGLTAISLQLQTSHSSTSSPWTWTLQWLPSGWQIRSQDVNWELPTHWLAGLGAPWNTLQPEGILRLQSQNCSLRFDGSSWQTSGQLTLTLQQFGTRLSSLKPLGDYQLTIRGANTSPAVDLKTLQGPLQMVGHGTWRPGGLQFDGEAWAHEPQDEAVLFNLLGVLGTRVGSRAILKVG